MVKLFLRNSILFISFFLFFYFIGKAHALQTEELVQGSVWQWSTASASLRKEGLTDIIAVSTGRSHSLALKKDGTVWAWGSNSNGQLGIGTVGEYLEYPVQVKDYDGQGYLTGVKEITTSNNGNFSMALRQDGTVWVWGGNNYGARGTGLGLTFSLNNLILPTQVKGENGTGFLLDVIAIAAGNDHALALKSDGRVFAWGRQDQGQVGTGGPTNYAIILIIYPERVISGVTSIAAGYIHSIVSRTDGSVWGWGRFDSGQLGSIPTDSGYGPKRYTPIKIPEIDNIKSVSAGYNTSLGLSIDGKVFEWGSGRYLPNDANPRQIPNLENVKSVAGGFFIPDGYIGAAVKEDGDLWVWNVKDLITNQVRDLSKVSMVSVGYDSTSAPNLAVVKMSESTPTPTPTPKTPLVLIPGVLGSEFKSNENFTSDIKDCGISPMPFSYNTSDIVWVNPIMAGISPCDDYFDVLKLKTDGQTPEYPQIVLNGTLFGGVYGNAIKFFTDSGYELNKTLFIFPYDWRLDISGTALLLDQKISDIKTQTGSQKVDIVAHSMGGLVARNYISDIARASNVQKLFTLGTPHLGSVEFLKNLRFGGCFVFEIGPFCLSIARSEVKDILQNLISGYELAPSQEYFNFYNNQDRGHPYPYSYNGQPFNYDQIKSFLTNLNYNTDLFNLSELFHALDNSLINTNGVEITNIAGSGLKTLGQIREKSVKDFFGNTVSKKDGVSTNGDKTVPLFSASLIDYSGNRSLLGNAKIFYTNQEHGELVASGSALNLVKNILNNDSQLPARVSTQPYSFSGTEMSIYSPVNIHVYDSSNNHTGPTADGNFEENIPGSSYNTLDDAKFIFLPNDGIYRIEFESEGRGSFDFKIRKYEDDEITNEILYKDIPLTEDTKAETEFDTSSLLPPVIQLDENGDSEIDSNINSYSVLTGDAIYDESSPTTDFQISGVLGNNGWFRSDVNVTLNPQDGLTGSGILKTEYSLDNGQTVNVYNGPFTISDEKINQLKFRSIDNAGNEEDPKDLEIKIDKTAPEAKIFTDQNKQELTVTGIDINSATVIRSDNKLTKRKDDAFYIITDLAGNSLKLDVHEADVSKQDRLMIYSIQYDDNPIKILTSNYFNVVYDGKKQRAHVKEQNFELKGEVKIRIQYDLKKNKSIIIVKKLKQKEVREVRSGLILLQLATDKGALYFGY